MKVYERVLRNAAAIAELNRLREVKKDLYDARGDRKDVVSSLYLVDGSSLYKSVGLEEGEAYRAVTDLVHDRLEERLEVARNTLYVAGIIDKEGEWIDE